ncbi:MAG TPA: hypothetical protein VFL76_08235 [Edaphocola sp.]|nr:hypothetical protein [Edaphocola sp.]
MKKILLLACAVLGMNLCFTSCSSDYDASPEVNNSGVRNPLQGTFTATINGVPFIADEKTISDTTINGIRSISVAGLAFNPDKNPEKNSTVTLMIPDYNGAHSYIMDGMTASGMYTIKDSANIQNFAAITNDTLSMITITGDGSSLEGNFNFKVIPAGSNPNHDTITIAEGNFSIPR